MAYIIDGHNLIGILPNISLAQPDDEARLIDLLLSYRARGAKEMIVFFDGNPLSSTNLSHAAQTIPSRPGLDVRYASHGKSADDSIVEFLRACREPGQYAVVTNDAGLIGRVKSLGASILRANEFAAQIARHVSPGKSARRNAATAGDVPAPDPRAPAFADLYDEFLAAERARKQLRERPQVDINTLIERLYGGDPQLQEQSARALGQSRDPRAIPPLRDALTSKDAGLRAAAALALGALHTQAALNDLVKLLQGDGNAMVREAAAQALGMIGSPKATTALATAAEGDSKGKVRKAAKTSLEVIRARRT